MTRRSKAVANWLFVGAAMVAIIVIIGGITRLTNSGLSIVDWKPISGVVPPLNETQWTAEFENYKSYPEYEQKHLHFTLSDFKKIYFWEYLHRLFARTIGLVFIIPFFIFLLTKRLRHPKLKLHLLIIFLLGAFQGFLGWYMVKSGLVDEPRVSHYRLAIVVVWIYTMDRSACPFQYTSTFNNPQETASPTTYCIPGHPGHTDYLWRFFGRTGCRFFLPYLAPDG